MSSTIKLEIATPEGMVYIDDVEMVTIPGVDGQMGILPEHTRLMTYLAPGRDDYPQERAR
jgi:F-type H+-transporting ATPase subunit epsilon